MIALQKISIEADFLTMCEIESDITKASCLKSWPLHIGGLCFDRYMYGNGAADIFTYGRLIVSDGDVIGYAFAYADEKIFVVRLCPEHSCKYAEAIKAVEMLFDSECATIANYLNFELCQALLECGYQKERFQSGSDLNSFEANKLNWVDEKINIFTEDDIADRVKYADIPTDEPITRQMYENMFRSDCYKNTLDYVIRDIKSNDFIGFVTWWMDKNNKTALLEPVACLPEYRRRGVMRRALLYGLDELKQRGINYVYVSTSIHNKKSQPLYLSVGFHKMGEAHRYTKVR